MKIISSYDARYSLRWTSAYSDIFYDGKFVDRAHSLGLEEAKKIFEVVARGKVSLEDVIRFNEAAQGMIGVDLSAMSYSNDRSQILYDGNFFANAF